MSFVQSLTVLALALFALVNDSARAEGLPVPTAEYSADRLIESERGPMTQKVHHAGLKERSETQMAGMQSVMIIRGDKKTAYMLMPAQKMYMEMDFTKAREQSGTPGEAAEITKEGTETVEGLATTKYKLVTADKKAAGFMWFTDDGIAVKMDLLSRESAKKSRMTMTLKNLQVGDQDDSLFEVPAGYTKMPGMGNMTMPIPGTR